MIRDMTNTIEEWPREWEQSLLFHGVPVPDNESFYTKVWWYLSRQRLRGSLTKCFEEVRIMHYKSWHMCTCAGKSCFWDNKEDAGHSQGGNTDQTKFRHFVFQINFTLGKVHLKLLQVLITGLNRLIPVESEIGGKFLITIIKSQRKLLCLPPSSSTSFNNQQKSPLYVSLPPLPGWHITRS